MSSQSQLQLQLQTAFKNALAPTAATAAKIILASATAAAAPAVHHTQPKTVGGTFIVAVGTAPYEVGGTP